MGGARRLGKGWTNCRTSSVEHAYETTARGLNGGNRTDRIGRRRGARLAFEDLDRDGPSNYSHQIVALNAAENPYAATHAETRLYSIPHLPALSNTVYRTRQGISTTAASSGSAHIRVTGIGSSSPTATMTSGLKVVTTTVRRTLSSTALDRGAAVDRARSGVRWRRRRAREGWG